MDVKETGETLMDLFLEMLLKGSKVTGIINEPFLSLKFPVRRGIAVVHEHTNVISICLAIALVAGISEINGSFYPIDAKYSLGIQGSWFVLQMGYVCYLFFCCTENFP